MATMLFVPRSPSIADDVRLRIIDRVTALQRNLTWLAHRIGKSKQWASDFRAGRGALTVDELHRRRRATGRATR